MLPGSFGAVVLGYLASPEFKATRPSTQRVYRLVLEKLAEAHGPKSIALLERRHVKAWRDARADTPAMANLMVKVVRVLLAYAFDNEYRRDNPAQRIKLFKTGEHRAWTDEECAAFEARWPAGSMQSRAYILAKLTGQRCGDLAAITRAHRKGGAIRVVQQKTGAELWVPEHRDLAAELALDVGGHMSLLTKPGPRRAQRPHEHGYVDGSKWRDIMSYAESCDGCLHIPYWSNPRVLHNGEPTGRLTEDNARVILEQAERVSKFR